MLLEGLNELGASLGIRWFVARRLLRVKNVPADPIGDRGRIAESPTSHTEHVFKAVGRRGVWALFSPIFVVSVLYLFCCVVGFFSCYLCGMFCNDWCCHQVGIIIMALGLRHAFDYEFATGSASLYTVRGLGSFPGVFSGLGLQPACVCVCGWVAIGLVYVTNVLCYHVC